MMEILMRSILKLFKPLLFLLLVMFCNNANSTIPYFVRQVKCLIPKGMDHMTRALLFQQCFSEKYGQGNETRCFKDLGCFPMEFPWISLLRPFPSPFPPEDVDTGITLYTRNAPKGYNVTLWPEITIKSSDFKYNRPATVFITHGFASNGYSDWLLQMKDAYLDHADANVFLVDWGSGASLLNYLQVASNTRMVAAELSRFVKYLLKNDLKTSKIHLIGHSLGAHVMAYLAKGLQSSSPIERITALDPAQPGFEGADKIVRLAKKDANHIDVIHTDARPFLPFGGFGMIQPVGDVDFYMNGGSLQPGCLMYDLPKITQLVLYPVELLSKWVSCSHSRSYEYFTWAMKLKNCSMWGRKMTNIEKFLKIASIGRLTVLDPAIEFVEECNENICSVLGFDTFVLKARGSFAVVTSPSKPYCKITEKLTQKLKKLFEKGVDKVVDLVRRKLLGRIF